MLKNILRIIRVMVSFIAVIVSPYACARVVHVPVEIPCGSNPMEAPWFTFKGAPRTQYTLTTIGLKEEGKEGIARVVETDAGGRTRDGLRMFAEAGCIPLNEKTDMSLTGNSLVCNMGQGLMVKMSEPNNISLDKYLYVGMLTITRYDEETREVAVEDVTAKVRDDEKEQSLQSDIKLTAPKVEVSSSY